MYTALPALSMERQQARQVTEDNKTFAHTHSHTQIQTVEYIARKQCFSEQQ